MIRQQVPATGEPQVKARECLDVPIMERSGNPLPFGLALQFVDPRFKSIPLLANEINEIRCDCEYIALIR